ncbi:indole-3-glycerol phosphate synthase TrpC [Desulfopila aestuarii]|uniref:Indole-3-glycerol phosphate synthase n=1 Tax=Desulfopila aestuarii DSM 18488 TaxID=1121416 RepID=A0A1M7YG73_9BACT|nr:indole-3-glycerol phosphate synthase TrpC [Desulfopila aestuarii]SHO51635.1 indole-3-glycerol phosphate synthase [Desulfopila aestuarii DSM 18488]
MILDTIVARKKEEVVRLRREGIFLPLEFREKNIEPPRGFIRALLDFSGVSIIAEVKKASPSKGVICHDFDPVRIALNYEKMGAQAVSVLTDVDFFQGSLLYLMQVRDAIKLPVIRKDFIIDPLQIEEARVHGADAILLIAAILDEHQLRDYRQQAEQYGMDALVEVHDEQELDVALAAGSGLIGVNNRNLKDFTMDLGTTLRLKKLMPPGIPVVSESGLTCREDIETLASAGIAAALIGESLMRAGNNGTLLQELR